MHSNLVNEKAQEGAALLESVGLPVDGAPDAGEIHAALPLPVPVPMTPGEAAAAARRAKKGQAPPAPPKVNKFLPDASYVAVYKRDSLGKLAFVNKYDARDLEASGGVEIFIQQHIVPTAGPGEYDVVSFGADGKPRSTIPIKVLRPDGSNAQPSETQELVGLVRQLAAQPHAPPKSMLEQLQEIEAAKKLLSGGDSSMGMLFAMQMLQGNNHHGPDPKLALIEQRLEMLAQQHAAPLPLPPLAPPPDPMDQMAKMMTAMAAFMPKPNNTADELVREMQRDLQRTRDELTKAQSDQLRGEIAELRRLLDKPARGLAEVLQEHATLVNFAEQLKGEQESFVSFLGKVVESGPAFVANLRAAGNDIERRKAQQLAATNGAAPPAEPPSLEFPDGLRPYLTAIESAAGLGQIVTATTTAMHFLAQQPEWKQTIMSAFQGILQDKRDVTLTFLQDWVDALQKDEMLSGESAQKIVATFTLDWELIREEISKRFDQSKPTAVPVPPMQATAAA